jgi:hypothetical protein
MNTANTDTNVSILGLPALLTRLFERAERPLLSESGGQTGLFIRYLRRKPARGLAVIYMVDEIRPTGSRTKPQGKHVSRSVSLTLDEKALNGAAIRFNASQVEQATLEVLPSGVLQTAELGLAVQAFPADNALPALAASCDTSPQSSLWLALQEAAQTQLGSAEWHLIAAEAEPVRYKPASRCVMRYKLVLANNTTSEQRDLTTFGKVYADAAQARAVQALQQQLYDEQIRMQQTWPLLPRPLGMLDAFGLTFNEAVQPAPSQQAGQGLRTGIRALEPHIERGRGGEFLRAILPETELRLTAEALVRLHTSTVHPGEKSLRTGAKEAKRARERAALIASRNAEQAEEVQQLAQQLAQRLETLQPDTYRPAHGGFKASQLLFHSGRVFVVDFDGFCLADPALDVGYFLAYLRPSGLWYGLQGMRQWFEQAAEIFKSSYRQAMLERGVSATEIDGIIHRAKLYEAALLFKIATRRANRLNSPRPKELSAMMQEIAQCLT